MQSSKYLVFVPILVLIGLQGNAQYKRKGETLANRGTATTAGNKKAAFTLAQFKGKWQEFERKDRSTNAVVPFNDSIQLKFTDSNRVQTRTSVITSMALDGYA